MGPGAKKHLSTLGPPVFSTLADAKVRVWCTEEHTTPPSQKTIYEISKYRLTVPNYQSFGMSNANEFSYRDKRFCRCAFCDNRVLAHNSEARE